MTDPTRISDDQHNNAPAVPQNTDHFEDDLYMVAPFGYFRPEPFGWTDCAKDDEGAIALYEHPQEVELRKELDSANDFIKSLADLIQKYETMLGYRTTNAPEGAYALAEAKGESSLNTELDLACADFTCQHDFALDPKSSIRICLKCGTPERLSKNAPAPAQEVATLSLSAEDVHAAFTKNFPKSRISQACISQAWINFAADIAQAIAARAAKPAQDAGLTDEAVNDAARVLAERFDYPWEHMPEEGRKNMRVQARAVVIAALHAKGGK